MGKLRVLFADDRKKYHDAFVPALLAHHQIAGVLQAWNPEEAIVLIEQGKVDAVMTDLDYDPKLDKNKLSIMRAGLKISRVALRHGIEPGRIVIHSSAFDKRFSVERMLSVDVKPRARKLGKGIRVMGKRQLMDKLNNGSALFEK